MANLLQSTAYVRTFKMYLAGTKTPATGKTIVVNLSKAGGALGAAAGAVAEISAGWYKVSFTTADTNTVGDLAVDCTEGTCDPTSFTDQVGPIPADLKSIDGLATSGNNATLNLKKLSVVNNAGDAAVFSSTGGNGNGMSINGNGTGSGIVTVGGTTGIGLYALGGATSGNGIVGQSQTSGAGISGVGAGAGNTGIAGQGGTNGPGIAGFGNGSGSGLQVIGGATGQGVDAVGGATSGSGIYAHAVGSGNGMFAGGTGNGTGILAQGSGSGSGVYGVGGTTGNGIGAQGGATSGPGFLATAVGAGAGISAVGVGSVSLLAAQGISGPLDATERDAIALAALIYDHNGITGEPNYCTLNAQRFNRHWAISGTVMTVYKENGTTPAYTVNLTPSASADPVVGFASV